VSIKDILYLDNGVEDRRRSAALLASSGESETHHRLNEHANLPIVVHVNLGLQ